MNFRARRTSLALVTFLFLFAGRQRAIVAPGLSLDTLPLDIYTHSEPLKIATTHLSLDLAVDSAAKVIRGTATLTLDNVSGTDTLILDTEDLTIEKVTLDDGSAAQFTLASPDYRGRALTIAIKPSTSRVTIQYATSPEADGLFWNTAAQSFGRQYPYLYSQNEPIDARSWIPIQDTPSMRMTYDARVKVDSGLMALMSAENPTQLDPSGVYTFDMPEPIPAYLIAIAVGRFEFHALDERTGVYAEPELLPAAARELTYIPEMVDVAERLAGPYPFERYDILLMPPTYIVGGMEHPRLNFIHPMSVVNGNVPAVPFPHTLIAHELAHTWAGDSTTLATWADVWLNEGITEYLTLRIIEEMSGTERVEFSRYTSGPSLVAYLNNFKANPDYTTLHVAVTPQKPASIGFTQAAYGKGPAFMLTLEEALGRATIDAFLRDYFATYAFRWVDERNFIATLRKHLGPRRAEIEEQVRLFEWIYSPGLPANFRLVPSSSLYDRVNAQVNTFRGGAAASTIDTTGWTPIEEELFIGLGDTAVRQRMAEVDAKFGFSQRETPPFVWLRQTIISRYEPGMPAVERALMRGGSNGQISNLYSLFPGSPLLPWAIEIFNRARDRYAPQTRQFVQNLLGIRNSVLQLEPPFRKAA